MNYKLKLKRTVMVFNIAYANIIKRHRKIRGRNSDDPKTATAQSSGFIAQLHCLGTGQKMIGKIKAAKLRDFAIFVGSNTKPPATVVVGFNSVGDSHGC
jgi:hypothetical protein